MHFLYFRWKNHLDPKFASTFRQIVRHDNFNLVLIINHDHIISFRRPFVSSQAGRRYYFSLSKRKFFRFTALVRRKNWPKLTLTWTTNAWSWIWLEENNEQSLKWLFTLMLGRVKCTLFNGIQLLWGNYQIQLAQCCLSYQTRYKQQNDNVYFKINAMITSVSNINL